MAQLNSIFVFALLALLVAVVVVASGDASGQPSKDTADGDAAAPVQPDDVIVIKGRDASAAEERANLALGEAELVTRINISQSSDTETLASVVGRSVGAEVRSVGGLGGFAAVSVRGLGAGHTPLLLDGVPVSRIATDTADLSRFDLHGFSKLELYRGAVPGDVAASGLGGALNLISAVGPRAEGQRGLISLGLGSFGARHLRARYLGGDDAFGYQVGVGYAGADGDYEFFNDNGTNLNTDDDTTERRTNNGFDRLDAVIRAREQRGARLVTGGARLIAKRQGLPGIGSRQTDDATLEGLTGVLDTTIVGERFGHRLRGQGFVMFDRQRVLDPGSEVGLGAGNSQSDTVSAGVGGGALRRAVGVFETLSLGVDLRGDTFDQHGSERASGARGALETTAFARVALGDRMAVVPQARLVLIRSRARTGDVMSDARTDVDVSPRLAALVRPSPIVTLKASAGYTVRQPTIVELFGDRGFLAGNPDIRAERGPSADVGVVVAPLPRPGVDDVLIEVAVFAARPTDAIVYAPSSAGVARPFNVDGARIAGAEISASMRIAHALRLTGNYTFLSAINRSDSESLDGNALPHRSRHQGYGQLAFETKRFGLWTDASLTSGNFIDQANIIELPARAFFGAGLRVGITPTLSFSVEGKNLTDNTVEMIDLDPAPRPDLARVPRPVSDFFGYPLPGRAVYASLSATL